MSKDRIICGIDIGSSKIATLITSCSHDEEKINVIGVSTVPAKGIRKGQVVDIEEAVAVITQSVEAAERMAGTTVTSAYVSIGGMHIACQNSHGVVAVSEPEGEITSADVKRVMEAAQAISLPSSREIIHVLPRNFTVDNQPGIKDPLGMTGVRLEVDTHIITGASTALRNLAKCINEVGINIEQMVFSGLSSSEAILTETEKELGVILVDIGGGTSNVSLYLDGALSYSSVLPVGAKNVTNDLAIGLRISLESAEKIKLSLSQTEKNVDFPGGMEKTKKVPGDELDFSKLSLPEEVKKVSRKTLIDGIIKPRLLEIFTLVSLEIQKSGFGGQTPAGIVVTGGGAKTVGIIEACKQRLSLPVRLGSFSGFSGLTEEIDSPAYATLSGLILYGLNKGEKKPGVPLFSDMGKIVQNFPLKGAIGKVIDLLKSFLP